MALFGRWRARERQLITLVHDAHAAAAKAHEAAQRVIAIAQASSEAERRDRLMEAREPGLRAIALTCWSVVAVAIAVTGILITTEAFADQPVAASASNDLLVAAAIKPTDDRSTRSPFNDVFFLDGSYSQRSNQTFYTFWFPRAFAGRAFVALATGTAILDEVRSPDTQISVERRTCELDPQSLNTPLSPTGHRVPCEAIHGRVPTVERAQGYVDCSIPTQLAGDYISVFVSGTGSIVTHPDWAHQVTNLPGLAPDRVTPTDLSRWNGLGLGGDYRTNVQTACKELSTNSSWEVVHATTQSSAATDYDMTWQGVGGISAVALETRSRSANRWANVWLAVSTTFGAVGIGFMPVAYESWRRRARHRSLLKASGSAA